MAYDKFSFWTISQKAFAGLFSYCMHTSLRGCRCASWGLLLLTNFFTFDFKAIIELMAGDIVSVSAPVFSFTNYKLKNNFFNSCNYIAYFDRKIDIALSQGCVEKNNPWILRE